MGARRFVMRMVPSTDDGLPYVIGKRAVVVERRKSYCKGLRGVFRGAGIGKCRGQGVGVG